MARSSRSRRRLALRRRQLRLQRRAACSKRRRRAFLESKARFRIGKTRATVRTLSRRKRLNRWPFRAEAPTVFCLRTNTASLAAFIGELDARIRRRCPTLVDLVDVTEIDIDAIILLLAVLYSFSRARIEYTGRSPKNAAARRVLQESGFFKHLFGEPEGRSILGGQYTRYTINKHNQLYRGNCVASEIAGGIVSDAATLLHGQGATAKGLYRTIIELMHNTNNHADPEEQGRKSWWLAVCHDPADGRVRFSFVDFGVGIFESLAQKPKSSILWQILAAIGITGKISDPAGTLRSIMDGRVHMTVTKKSYRGKGLPGIRETFDRGSIEGLLVLTNSAYADFAANSFTNLTSNFNGTLVSWALTKSSTGFHPVAP